MHEAGIQHIRWDRCFHVVPGSRCGKIELITSAHVVRSLSPVASGVMGVHWIEPVNRLQHSVNGEDLSDEYQTDVRGPPIARSYRARVFWSHFHMLRDIGKCTALSPSGSHDYHRETDIIRTSFQ